MSVDDILASLAPITVGNECGLGGGRVPRLRPIVRPTGIQFYTAAGLARRARVRFR